MNSNKFKLLTNVTFKCFEADSIISAYRFLLIFKRGPKLLQFRWNWRARKLQGFDDVTSITDLLFCDEGVGITLEGRSETKGIRICM